MTSKQPANNQQMTTSKESKEIQEVKNSNSRFTPPTVQEVSDYCNERMNQVDPQRFVDHYSTNNWFRGKTKTKDWKACVRTWEANDKGNSNGRQRNTNGIDFEQLERDFDREASFAALSADDSSLPSLEERGTR